jgi:hypothetical protein
VNVTIRNLTGDVVESGAAAKPPNRNGRWVYKTTVAAPESGSLVVEAVAVNWPGKSGRGAQVVPG